MDKTQLKPVNLDANLLGQFWTSAADVFIEIVKSQDPEVRQSIDRSISSGGDVEITAHNQAGKDHCDFDRGIRAAACDLRRYGQPHRRRRAD